MLNFTSFIFVCRAKAKPSKKARVNKPSKDQVVLEQEQTYEPDQTREPEGPHPDATFDEPAPQDQNINEQTEADTAIPDTEPAVPIQASPVRVTSTPPSPVKTTGGQGDDVIIIGMGHSSPGHPVILAKHSAKEERAAMEKGKWSTDLSSYAHLSAEELHSGFLNRLHSNRDYEAGLVNLMKEHYDVFSSPFLS